MTNSEAVEQLKMQMRNAEDCLIEDDVLEYLLSALEENTKLKAEIEQLRIDYKDEMSMVNEYTDIMVTQRKEIEQLKKGYKQLEIRLTKKTEIETQLRDIIDRLKSELKCESAENKWNQDKANKLWVDNKQLKEELHQLTHRNCLQCFNYGKCSINDNFNITNCSDFKLKGKVSE